MDLNQIKTDRISEHEKDIHLLISNTIFIRTYNIILGKNENSDVFTYNLTTKQLELNINLVFIKCGFDKKMIDLTKQIILASIDEFESDQKRQIECK